MARLAVPLVLAIFAASMLTASAAADGRNPINAYRVDATPQNLKKLALAGFDVTEGRRGSAIEIYATAGQARKLRDSAVDTRRVPKAGQTASLSKALADPYTGSDAPYKVWRRFDSVPNDGKEQYLELYDRLAQRGIVERHDLGDSYLGRDFIALKVTKDAKTNHPRRPAVLYNALQHSREWLAGETCRRSLLYFVNNYGVDERVTRLVDSRELWFYCVANPDGYEYSFTEDNRLWRKNMADNDGDGIRGENGDGVDPNRNFPEKWGLDNEGSSPSPASETYRGPEPYQPEPETRAMLGLFDRADFAFQKNDHTAAELILYPQGWQQYTPTADDPIFTALAGTDKNPAINGFDPDLGAELYVTNGETTDTAYNREGILSYTPEGTIAKDLSVSGFEYADSEGEIQAEFTRHRNFVIDLAESAGDPAEPVSHLRNDVQDFYVDTFAESFGDPQKVQVLAKRSLGAVKMRYRINGGTTHEVSTSEVTGEERYNREPGVYMHALRGTVTQTDPGDSVEVWFEKSGGGSRSASFTYRAAVESSNRVLVLAAEDYTGPTPAQDPSGPKYADEYLAAVQANGLAADLYDVDARGRRAPDPLGILSHYDAVLWYTGDDYLTREPGQVPGTGTSRLAIEEQLAVRDYLNEGGKILYAGKHAGQQYVEGFEFRNFGFPQPNEDKQGRWCDSELFNEARDGCIAHVDDFLQYYLGAYLRVDNGGSWQPDGTVYPVTGLSPFGVGPWTFANTPGDPGAGAPTAALAVTSSLIDRPAYQDSRALADWDRPAAGPFSPHTGTHYMATGHDDESYKRLHTTVDLTTAESGGLNFWTSYDLEPNWDHLFVEVRPVGTEEWTTLPDSGGHTSQATGEACFTDGGWWQLHARMLNYQTVTGDSCTPTGTTGQWHAATAGSNGWQEWQINLPVGQPLEVAIVVATDWAFGNLGAWVDDATITVDGATASTTSFEADTGVWATGPSPDGTPNAAPQWTRSPQQFEEGAVVGTTDTVYAGFEVATMSTAGERASFMHEVLQHLGILPPD